MGRAFTPGTEDFAARLRIFASNAKVVEELNAAYDGVEFSLEESPFAHLSFDEFARRLPTLPRGALGGKKQPGATIHRAHVSKACIGLGLADSAIQRGDCSEGSRRHGLVLGLLCR